MNRRGSLARPAGEGHSTLIGGIAPAPLTQIMILASGLRRRRRNTGSPKLRRRPRGPGSRPLLSRVGDAAQHGGRQSEKVLLREVIGFRRRIDGALFVGLVGDDADVVLLQFPLSYWHLRCLPGTPIEPPCRGQSGIE